MVKTIDNKFAVLVIIIIVVGLFLHYEKGRFDLFTVGGKRRPHGRWNHPSHHHHYNRYRNVYHPWVHSSIFSHEPTIYEKHNKLKQDYDTLKTHHDSGVHEHRDQCTESTGCDDDRLHTGGKPHSATVYSV
tara:strand:- start:16512 stop:16904 length:393 start_codon:yes stop_codon:yes gene_type:complete